MRAIGDVVIHAQGVFTARVFRRDGRGVVDVVEACDVRQRKEVENRLTAAEVTIRRDYVHAHRVVGRRARGITEAGCLVSCVALAALRRWVSDKDWIPDIVPGLREIAVPFGLRRHTDSTLSFRDKLLVPFLIPIEEEFVFLLVET